MIRGFERTTRDAGTSRCAGTRCGYRIIFFDDSDDVSCSSSSHLAHDVDRDAERPRAQLALAPEAREQLQEPQRRLLRRVARLLVVAAQHAQAEAEPRVLELAQQLRLCGA